MWGSRLFQVGNFSSVEFIYVQQITHQNHYVSMSIQNLFFIFSTQEYWQFSYTSTKMFIIGLCFGQFCVLGQF